MLDAAPEARMEAVAPPATRLSANDVGTDERCFDRAKLDADLGKRLFNDENATFRLLDDASKLQQKFPDLTLDQALVKALDDGKEEVAKKQQADRASGIKTPPLGQMLVEAGLVTQKQVDSALLEQGKRKPAPRIGDLLVELLQANIADARRLQNCKT